MNKIFGWLSATVLLLVMGSASAQMSAHQTVEDVMGRLFADLQQNRESYKQNPEDFYAAMDVYIGETVDVAGIARSVMTVRYSKRATAAQMTRFEQNFKNTLLRFYANALLEYNNNDVRILPPLAPESAERAEVRMEVKDTRGTVYPVSYTMVKINDRWMLRNVIIEGINVGKLFRDQFAESMQRNRNNLDVVIDSWAETVARNQQIESAQ